MNTKIRTFEDGHMMYKDIFDLNWYSTEKNTETGCNTIRKMIPTDRLLPIMFSLDFTDYEGKTIYAGDIYEQNGYYGLIEWNNELLQFQLTWRHQRAAAADIRFMVTKYMEQFKKVGNIHETPDLWPS